MRRLSRRYVTAFTAPRICGMDGTRGAIPSTVCAELSPAHAQKYPQNYEQRVLRGLVGDTTVEVHGRRPKALSDACFGGFRRLGAFGSGKRGLNRLE